MESQGYNFEYVYHDSGDREELEFVIETFSICQIEFSSHSKLVINSQKDLTEILTQYNWVHPPIVLRSTAEQNLFLPAFLKDISGLTSYLKTSKAYAWAKYLKDNLNFQSEAKRTIYLIYSDEIFDWKSLTEATEGIIGYWFRQLSDNLEIEIINLKNNSNSHEAKRVLALANEVVLIKISPTVANFLKRLRLFNPACCLCFYGFESSSVYFANIYRYELEPFLREEDSWIMSCKSDADLAKLSWENINTITIPLKFPDRHRSQRESNPRNLLYVGRYSEQKNLQDLIFAAHLVSDKMRTEGRKLKLFGYEDFFGSTELRNYW